MEFQQLFNLAFGVVILPACGWFARQMWTSVQELKSDLAKLREELPKTYVARDDYKSDIKEIKDMLMKLMEKLGDKADRT